MTNSRHNVLQFFRTALVLSGVIPLTVGCADETSVGQLPSAKVQAWRERAEIKMPKELWVTSQGDNVIFIRNFEDLSPVDQITLPSGAGAHIITFHTPDFAYVGGMTDGNVYVIDANSRQVVKRFHVAPTLAHQVKVSPDGATALVSIISTKTVTKMLVDEANRGWSLDASLDLGAMTGKAPICTVFRADSRRAFISLNPSGLAVVDVPTMTYSARSQPTASSPAA